MDDRPAGGLSIRLPDVTARRGVVTPPHGADRRDVRSADSAPVRAGSGQRPDVNGMPSRKPLSPFRGASTAGGMVPSDDELLEHALAFSGSYVSDDGQVTIRRAFVSFDYSAARFTGHCALCTRVGLTPATGEPLSDIRSAVQFVAAHDHGDGD